MKYTVLPPGPEPKRHTASCPQMVAMLKGGDDLTINQHRTDTLYRPGSEVPFEDRLAALLKEVRRD